MHRFGRVRAISLKLHQLLKLASTRAFLSTWKCGVAVVSITEPAQGPLRGGNACANDNMKPCALGQSSRSFSTSLLKSRVGTKRGEVRLKRVMNLHSGRTTLKNSHSGRDRTAPGSAPISLNERARLSGRRHFKTILRDNSMPRLFRGETPCISSLNWPSRNKTSTNARQTNGPVGSGRTKRPTSQSIHERSYWIPLTSLNAVRPVQWTRGLRIAVSSITLFKGMVSQVTESLGFSTNEPRIHHEPCHLSHTQQRTQKHVPEEPTTFTHRRFPLNVQRSLLRQQLRNPQLAPGRCTSPLVPVLRSREGVVQCTQRLAPGAACAAGAGAMQLAARADAAITAGAGQ